ncbi:MAG: tRNA (adenosine(37)-N6)-threonylcarbamoyltransferase complex transferase subunit TsaD, partial [Verrucomicrobiae bacterium]|nr:tRNA (adenosine(37)-N6)-threonylcarbamoyltransferase complex transferase subunit TsaD [Verrucomicrobiae bacterium]
FQEAVIDVLVAKTLAAAETTGEHLVTVSGGVSCNHRLREAMTSACAAAGLELRIAAPAFTTDNAAMIAFAAAIKQGRSADPTPLDQDIDPNLGLG